MSIITLTTDYGDRDYAVGALHGAIRKLHPNLIIEDVCHSVEPFDVGEGTYILSHAAREFPANTVHVFGVNSAWSPNNPHLVARFNDQFFISADNGFFHILTAIKNADQLVELEIPSTQTHELFPVRDLFVPAAVHLAKGGQLSVLGKPFGQKLCMYQHMPTVSQDGNRITGQIISIDRFGNCITNITRELYHRVGLNRNFSAQLPRTGSPKMEKIHEHYFDDEIAGNTRTEILLFNSANHLEIAIQSGDLHKNGGAARLLGLKRGDHLTIDFR